MGKLLKSLVLASSIFVTSPLIASESDSNLRINPSISYRENIRFFEGALEDYNPLRFRLGFEFDDSDAFWFFNKYTLTPFFGKIQGDYDVGFDYGLKRIFREDSKIRPFIHSSMGIIYFDKELEEHKEKWNFHLNLEAGMEIELGEFDLTTTFGLEHSSMGKKLKNNIIHRTTRGDNDGNPGIDSMYVSLGVIYRFD